MNIISNEVPNHILKELRSKDKIAVREKYFYIFTRNREAFIDCMKCFDESNFILCWNIFEDFHNWGKEIYDGRPDRLNEQNGYFIRFKIVLKHDKYEVYLDFLTKSNSKYKKLDNYINII